MSTEVIEHLFSPHLLPQFAHHVLKPGGYLVLTTPYYGYVKNTHRPPFWRGGHIKSKNDLRVSKKMRQAVSRDCLS